MNLLAGKNYDPGTAVTANTTAALAMTALDTTNLRLAFVVPASGIVRVKMVGVIHGATTFPSILLGVLEGSNVKGRQAPMQVLGNTAVATALVTVVADFLVTGLTPAASLSWDAAYGVETLIASTGLKYGGPNNTVANDAWGGFAFEIWDPCPNYTPTSGTPPTTPARTAIDAIKTKTDFLPSVTAGAAGGLFIAGTNAATTVTTSFTTTFTGNLTGSIGSIAANAITAAATAADFGTEIGTAVWASATRQLTASQTFNLTGNLIGNVTGSVATVTGTVDANMTQVSGDGPAADNWETMLDGTGGQTLTLKSLVINNGSGVGLSITGSTYGAQISGTNNGGVYILSPGGIGLTVASIANYGSFFQGGGAFPGIKFEGGLTGAGIEAIGGATSGNGIKATGVGSSAGIQATGGNTGDGILATGGPTDGFGMNLMRDGGTSGLHVDGDADMNIGGTVGSVVGSVGSIAAGGIATTSFAAGAINSAAIATDAIGADELAASAVAEIVSAIGGVGAFAITVTVNDGVNPLQNVDVSVFDGGGALAGRGTTNASGQTDLSLAAGTYTVALVKANYNFAPVSRTVTGNQAGSIVTAMSMTIIAPIVPSGNPLMCVVAGFIKDLNGNALVGSLVKARLVPATANRPITSDGNVLALEADEAITDGLGFVSMELIRTDEIDQDGCTYTFVCVDAQMDERNVKLESATLDISTL